MLRKYVAAPRFSPWRREGTTAQYARRSDWRVGSNKRAALTAQNQDRSRSGPDQDHERVHGMKRADLQKRRRAEPRKRLRPEKSAVRANDFCRKKGKKKAGDVLLSHTVTHAVPSTQKSLTSEFGMGSGVASSLLSPARFKKAVESWDVSVRPPAFCFQRGGEVIKPNDH